MAENVLTAQGLRKSWGDKVLFRDISFGLEARQKVGLLGTNGSGKSTLLKILGDRESDYAGTVTRRKDMHVHYLEQEAALVKAGAWKPAGPGLPEGLRVADFIFSAFGKIGESLARYHALASPGAAAAADGEAAALLADLERRIDGDHGWSLYREVVSTASQLDVDLGWTLRPALSGGQLKKIQLVRALCGEPDLLLLDEPTNHLDEGTIRWLEDRLIRFGGTLVLITHDRYFLERAVDHILELWTGSIQGYPGNYERYLEKKAELEANLARQDEKRLAFLRDEIDWIRRGPKARGTKAKARIDRYEEAKNKEGFAKAKSLDLELEGSARLGKTILEVEGLRKSYGNNLLFQGLDLSLLAGDRIGILGPNGCGKSTFLRILLGQEKPDAGEAKVGVNTVMGYFDQKRAGLDPEKTVWQSLAGDSEYIEFGGVKRPKRSFLEGFLFTPSLQNTLVARLSGGEQNRLQLAAALVSNPANLLLLDEPTNDLDIPTLQVLEEALIQFPGCALIVSHDRYFLDRVATAMLVFSTGGKVRLLPGNYTAYLEAEELAREAEKPAAKVSEAPAKKRSTLAYLEKKELDGIEKAIADKEEIARAAEEALNAASASGDFSAVQRCNQAWEEARAAVDAGYARWEWLEKKARGEDPGTATAGP